MFICVELIGNAAEIAEIAWGVVCSLCVHEPREEEKTGKKGEGKREEKSNQEIRKDEENHPESSLSLSCHAGGLSAAV